MLIEEQDCECSVKSTQSEKRQLSRIDLPQEPLKASAWNRGAGIRLFEQTAPLSFAEQFPRLMIFAVIASILVAALTAEIECLRGAGYYWF